MSAATHPRLRRRRSGTVTAASAVSTVASGESEILTPSPVVDARRCACGAAATSSRIVGIGAGPRTVVHSCTACGEAFERGTLDGVQRADLAWRAIARAS